MLPKCKPTPGEGEHTKDRIARSGVDCLSSDALT